MAPLSDDELSNFVRELAEELMKPNVIQIGLYTEKDILEPEIEELIQGEG